MDHSIARAQLGPLWRSCDARFHPWPLLLGIAGLIPFAACGYGAVTNQGDPAAMALAAYGAVILAFLGGVHWGFALPEPSGRGERARLGLGVLPSLVGWVALLLEIAVDVEAGLALLVVGFLALTIVEARATKAGLVPSGYMTFALRAVRGGHHDPGAGPAAPPVPHPRGRARVILVIFVNFSLFLDRRSR